MFHYHAMGMAMGGQLSRPTNHYIEPHAATVLPLTGGRASAKAPAFSLTLDSEFIVSYDSAETAIEGSETSPGVHSTTIISTIRKLNVLNILKADEVTAKLSLRYDTAADECSIDTSGSRFVNLTIAGEPWPVELDHDLARAASNYDRFRREHPDHRESRGRIVHSLARHPRLRSQHPDFGFHHEPGFGRIYFGEWTAAPNTQGLTMMRLRLGSPAAGHLQLGGGSGNGTPYP